MSAVPKQPPVEAAVPEAIVQAEGLSKEPAIAPPAGGFGPCPHAHPWVKKPRASVRSTR